MAEEARKQPGVAKEYRNDQIAVFWEPAYCIHVASCIRALPGVFDPAARPWIDVDGASADDIATAVMSCPTGALHFRRLDGGEQEEPSGQTSVHPRTNGPLFVRGSIRVVDASGELVRNETRAAFCRCGQSANKPFCDGTHRAIGFKAD